MSQNRFTKNSHNEQTLIIGIVGKTSSGKDTIARYIQEQYGLPFVVSCTTRPKRDYETDGKEHWFVSPEQMAALMTRDDVIAYTKFPQTGIEYCATAKDLDNAPVALYIINPDGVRWFNQHRSSHLTMQSIYVHLDEDIIRQRAGKRGDASQTIEARLNSERQEMDDFAQNQEWDYRIDTNTDLASVYAQVDEIMDSLLRDNPRINTNTSSLIEDDEKEIVR